MFSYLSFFFILSILCIVIADDVNRVRAFTNSAAAVFAAADGGYGATAKPAGAAAECVNVLKEKCDVSIDEIAPCKNFENKKVGSNITQELFKDDEYPRMALKGFLHVFEGYKIVEGMQMEMQVMKEDENGKELVMGMKFDFCQSLNEEDPPPPHKEVMEKIGIKSCPIESDKYYFPEKPLYVDMSALTNLITKDNAGAYTVRITLLDPQKPDPSHPDICYEVDCVVQEQTAD